MTATTSPAAQHTLPQPPPERPLAAWIPTDSGPAFDPDGLTRIVANMRATTHVIQHPQTGHIGLAQGGQALDPAQAPAGSAYALLATVPPLYPEWLGSRGFLEAHNVRFPYVAGAMANGIATAEMVIAMAHAGMLGFFGSAGLAFDRVRDGLDAIAQGLAGAPSGVAWGANLIHSPQEPELEARVADLFIQRGVPRVSASAYMRLTPAIVRYAYSGLRALPDGRIARPHAVFAKISRPEVAAQFMRPAPAAILDQLVRDGLLTPAEAQLAAHLPVAEDITVESDSGGHTDNRPLGALFPSIRLLRDQIAQEFPAAAHIRLGAAGGLGTPDAVAAAFGLGASYVLTGSVNQAAVEAGLSPAGKAMLARADLADVTMAPAADMFELGVELQVLKRGTLFAQRARRLYDVYRTHDSLDAIAPDLRQQLERRVFSLTLDEVWHQTHAFWADRDPNEVARAERDPRHKMALAFRWYLGRSSRWAISGDTDRVMDYQIWCGPAMGAFNAWVKGSVLDPLEARTVVQIALNLLEGAAQITRAGQLRALGVAIPEAAYQFAPRSL